MESQRALTTAVKRFVGIIVHGGVERFCYRLQKITAPDRSGTEHFPAGHAILTTGGTSPDQSGYRIPGIVIHCAVKGKLSGLPAELEDKHEGETRLFR